MGRLITVNKYCIGLKIHSGFFCNLLQKNLNEFSVSSSTSIVVVV